MIIVSILLGLGGIALTVFNKTLAPLMYQQTQLPFYKMFSDFGLQSIDPKSFGKFFVLLNRVGLVFAGLVLIFIAYVMIFGPISL